MEKKQKLKERLATCLSIYDPQREVVQMISCGWLATWLALVALVLLLYIGFSTLCRNGEIFDKPTV